MVGCVSNVLLASFLQVQSYISYLLLFRLGSFLSFLSPCWVQGVYIICVYLFFQRVFIFFVLRKLLNSVDCIGHVVSVLNLGTSLWQLVDPKTGEEKKVIISDDDGIRPETTLADLAKLKTVFKKSGSTTAGISECHLHVQGLP